MKATWGKLDAAETRERITQASKEVSSILSNTLGPLGRDTMVVRRQPDNDIRVMITSDGIALFEEFEGETKHVIANRYLSLAEAQEADYGDGTTMVVFLAAELVSAGLELIDEGLHPRAVIEGFSIGAQRTIERWNTLSNPVDLGDGSLNRDELRAVAETAMINGRTADWPLDELATSIVDAVLRVSEPAANRVRLANAPTRVVPGGDLTETRVLDGAVIPDSIARGDHLLPLTGNIVLAEGNVRPEQPSGRVSIDVEDPSAVEQFRQGDGAQADAIAEKLAAEDVVLVVAGGDVAGDVVHALQRRGILTVRNLKDSRVELVAAATGATPFTRLSATDPVPAERLGSAHVAYERVKLDDQWVSLYPSEGNSAPRAATILVRGGTDQIASEAERRIKKAKNALRAVIIRPETLPAGGSPDIAASMAVDDLAPSIEGRKQLAVERFADVLMEIPLTLARHAGHEPNEAISDLRATHDDGSDRAGIGASGDIVEDVTAHGGVDPYLIRTTSLVRAVEFANQLLRVDETLLLQGAVIGQDDETENGESN